MFSQACVILSTYGMSGVWYGGGVGVGGGWVSVQRVSAQGGVCPRGVCLGGVFQGGVCTGQLVRILLECICDSMTNYYFISPADPRAGFYMKDVNNKVGFESAHFPGAYIVVESDGVRAGTPHNALV